MPRTAWFVSRSASSRGTFCRISAIISSRFPRAMKFKSPAESSSQSLRLCRCSSRRLPWSQSRRVPSRPLVGPCEARNDGRATSAGACLLTQRLMPGRRGRQGCARKANISLPLAFRYTRFKYSLSLSRSATNRRIAFLPGSD